MNENTFSDRDPVSIDPDYLDHIDVGQAPNALKVTHAERATDGLVALNVIAIGMDAPYLLTHALHSPAIALAIEDPTQDPECEHPATPGRHQTLRLHLNAGRRYGHANCMVAPLCVGCNDRDIDTIMRRGRGYLRQDVPSLDAWAGNALFTVVNRESGLAAIARTQSLLTP